MKSVLLAADFSDRTPQCVDYAVQYVQGHDARIDVVHVLPGAVGTRTLGHPAAQELMADLARREEGVGRRKVDEVLMSLPEIYRGEALLEHGDPADKICEVAGRGYDLVVISTHGRTGLRHALLGSVAEAVVRRVSVPVLVVR